MTDRIPLDRADWPKVGDEVLYHRGRGGWTAATVLEVAPHDGDLRLDVGDGVDVLDAKHGTGPHRWVLYAEHALATKAVAR
ncbi:MAG: hypothetical protein HOV66_07635 [Streptomycetaceae bacterium]|nr:hypothetical protein [Streptomycetaceae bacterium]